MKDEKGKDALMYLINSDCDSNVPVHGWMLHFEQKAQAWQQMADAVPQAGFLALVQVGSLVDTGRIEGKSIQLSLLAEKVFGAGKPPQKQSKKDIEC